MATINGKLFAIPQAYFLPPRRDGTTANSLPMTSSLHMARVAERLRLFMELRGVKTVEAAKFLGVTTSKFGNWTGGRAYPNEYLMTLFCARYGMTMDYLYRGMTFGLPGDVADDLARAEAEISAASPERPVPAPAIGPKS